MNRIVLPGILAILVIAGPSCRSNDAAPSSPVTSVDVIIPLAAGNQWVARVASWDSSGRANVTGIDTARIVRDTTILLERWFVDNKGNHVTNRSTGYWVLSSTVPLMFLKYPVSLNDNYPYGNAMIRVVSRDTSISVSAGTFSCVCYNIIYGTQSVARQILLASPNKGIVRREVVARTPSGREYLESRADLQTFQLK